MKLNWEFIVKPGDQLKKVDSGILIQDKQDVFFFLIFLMES